LGPEAKFQKQLKKDIKERFPGCYILKNDPNQLQGIPDLTVLWEDKWAMLEVKASKSAKHRPNQDEHVERLNSMSYAAFVYPENEEDVLDALERSFKGTRTPRSVQSEPTRIFQLDERRVRDETLCKVEKRHRNRNTRVGEHKDKKTA
jgi:hypothetical protein